MDSLVKAVRSLPVTTPVPAVPPPPRDAVMGDVKPSEVNAPAVLVMLRFCAVPVCMVMAPVEALMVGVTPVMAAIFESSVPTLSVMSILLPAVPVVTKVSVVPSTTMVLPATKLEGSELLGAVPDRAVAAVIGAGVVAWLKAEEPVMVLSVGGAAGVHTGKGLEAKSAGLSPPSATRVPVAADELAGVFGWVGRFAAYWMALVACAGMKLFWNCRTCGTLPVGLPVLGSTDTPIR